MALEKEVMTETTLSLLFSLMGKDIFFLLTTLKDGCDGISERVIMLSVSTRFYNCTN